MPDDLEPRAAQRKHPIDGRQGHRAARNGRAPTRQKEIFPSLITAISSRTSGPVDGDDLDDDVDFGSDLDSNIDDDEDDLTLPSYGMKFDRSGADKGAADKSPQRKKVPPPAAKPQAMPAAQNHRSNRVLRAQRPPATTCASRSGHRHRRVVNRAARKVAPQTNSGRTSSDPSNRRSRLAVRHPSHSLKSDGRARPNEASNDPISPLRHRRAPEQVRLCAAADGTSRWSS